MSVTMQFGCTKGRPGHRHSTRPLQPLGDTRGQIGLTGFDRPTDSGQHGLLTRTTMTFDYHATQTQQTGAVMPTRIVALTHSNNRLASMASRISACR